MKQLRLLLLMLVACMAQVSMAQSTVDKLMREAQERKWHDEAVANYDKGLITILMRSPNNDDAKKYMDRWVDTNNSQYFKYDERVEHTKEWLNNIKWKLPKWDEKLSKGKKINAKDAIKAAVAYASGYNDICQVDYAKAEKYFRLVDLNVYKKNEIDMCIIGCQYMTNKDKAAVLAGMTFNEPTDELLSIAMKYGMEDIYDTKLQQLAQAQLQTIKRAVRSHDMETLKKFKAYEVPKVDSILAINGDEECLDRCLRKHQIKNFVVRLPLENERFLCGEFLTYPDAIFERAFIVEDHSDNKYKILNTISDMLYFGCTYEGEMYDTDPTGRQKAEEKMMNLLDGFGKKSIMAGYTMTAMVQIMGLNGRYKYSRDLRVALTKALANYIKKDPKLKTYGDFNYFFTIDDNGNITLVNIPKVEYANYAQFGLLVPLYEEFIIAINNL